MAEISKRKTFLAPAGSFGSVLAVTLCPICKPALAAFLASIGLGIIVHESVMQSILIVFLILTFAGLFWSCLKVHRKIIPLILGVILGILLYVGRYVYFGSWENNILTYGSLAGLVAVSLWNLTLKKPAGCLACKEQKIAESTL